MKKIIIGLCLMLMSSGSFGLSLKSYTEGLFPRGDLKVYLTGVYHGLSLYNATIIKYSAPKNILRYTIFCPPDITLRGENLIDILDKYLEENPQFKKVETTTSVSAALKAGLSETFPCKD